MNPSQEAIELLKQLIATQSFSKEEAATFEILKDFFLKFYLKARSRLC
jgi:hypothetical protein